MHINEKISNLLVNISSEQYQKIKLIIDYLEPFLSKVNRNDFENYFEHDIDLLYTLFESNNYNELIPIALFHDVLSIKWWKQILEKSILSKEEKRKVYLLSQLSHIDLQGNKNDFNNFLDIITKNSDLVPIRLAHRLNDIRNINKFNLDNQNKLARETLHIYSALSWRFWIYKWRYEMEDIAFSFLYKEKAEFLKDKFNKYKNIDNYCLEKTKEFLNKQFVTYWLNVEIESRLKSLYSTYRKIIIKKRKFEDLTDRLAIRIITDNEEDCYKILYIIHKEFHIIPWKLKDYIGCPKENWYQSIHTVIYPLPWVTQLPIEIQIRSKSIHQACLYWTASHENYKSNCYLHKSNNTKVNLIKNFEFLEVKWLSPKDFENTLKKYFNEDKIAVFDSDNNLYNVKRNLNIIDFLRIVYWKKIKFLKEIYLNWRKASIDEELKEWDVIQWKFWRKKTIKKDWIIACKSKYSKKFIKEILKKQINKWNIWKKN